LNDSLAVLNFEEMNREMQTAMNSIDAQKLSTEMQQSLGAVDFKKIQKEMQELENDLRSFELQSKQ
jgi:hypothetical protein